MGNNSVLDHGFVHLIDLSLDKDALKNICNMFLGGKNSVRLAELPHATIHIRCPLFFQLYLHDTPLKIIPVRGSGIGELFYKPNQVEVMSDRIANTKDAADISSHIGSVIDALKVSSAGYRADGCDPFTSQCITPVAAYVDILVYGSMRDWCELLIKTSRAEQIEAYKKSIKEHLAAEWFNLDSYIELVGYGKQKEETKEDAENKAEKAFSKAEDDQGEQA